MILILRFYHWPGGSTAWSPWQHRKSLEPLPVSEEWLVAWSALRLTRLTSSEAQTDLLDTGNGTLVWNAGIHDLPLYHSPAPNALNLSTILPEHYEKVFEQYGSARVRLCVFSTSRPDFPFLPESPSVCRPIPGVPEDVFIPHSRSRPATDPFSAADGIDLYIDGTRYLPDAVTVSRVTGRIFDKNFDQYGPDICTEIDFNSDIFHPSYKYSLQIRSLNLPPTATLLLKVYTIDRFTQRVSLIGWAALNLYVESGSEKAPSSNSGDIKISLNDGAHQIRVYHRAPPTDQPFSAESLSSSGRIVPCSTLLVRVVKTPNNINTHTTQKDGELQPTLQHPEYSQGIYYSDQARPTQGEIELYRAMMNRSVVLVKDVIPVLAGSVQDTLISPKQLSDWVQKTFTEQMAQTPPPFDLCCISRYHLKSGMKVSLDRALNLPWSGFSMAHICLNPPGAFYLGHPWLKYDRPVPVDDIDLDSHQKCPVWQDGFKTFTHRIFHKHLTVLIHLHEILPHQDVHYNKQDTESGNSEPQSQKEAQQTLMPGIQAWTALQVFYNNYCNMGVYQLPLYQGAPSPDVLQALSLAPCAVTLKDLEQKQVIDPVPGASVLVRIADGRRFEELNKYDPQDINLSYLSEDAADLYNITQEGEKLSALIPDGQKDFKKNLVYWFRKHLSQSPDSSYSMTAERT
ncbi:uncharacterized protein LOC134569099 [Pelobates fuscus]|uniref:uncharacterized protein LOC134569099 n=1 Tax=Pelobates fuscus TaxID=191477 RepID=UPI002FE4EDBB